MSWCSNVWSRLTNLIQMVYELAGDFGLVFFLFIIVVDLYTFHWQLPKKIIATTSDPIKARNRVLHIKFYSTIPLIILGLFAFGILFVVGPPLWLKVLAGLVSVVVVGCVIGVIWQFISS
jgi:hypothetical protein